MLYAYARKNTAPVTPVAVVSNSGPTDLYDDNFYHNNALGDEAAICDLMSKACGQRFMYDTKEEVQRAYEIMKDGSKTIYKMEATPYSSCRVVFVDKFGIRWGIMTEQTEH